MRQIIIKENPSKVMTLKVFKHTKARKERDKERDRKIKLVWKRQMKTV